MHQRLWWCTIKTDEDSFLAANEPWCSILIVSNNVVTNSEPMKSHWSSVNNSSKEDASDNNNNNQKNLDDDPCWGTPTQCSLSHLLQKISCSEAILYESDDYLVLNKPPDLRMDGSYAATVHKLLTYWYPSPSLLVSNKETAEAMDHENDDDNDPQQTSSSSSLSLLQKIDGLKEFSDTPDNELRPCHRLDYATSGVLLVARNRAAAAHAKCAFEQRQVGKRYTALVNGHVRMVRRPNHHNHNNNNNNNNKHVARVDPGRTRRDVCRLGTAVSTSAEKETQRNLSRLHATPYHVGSLASLHVEWG